MSDYIKLQVKYIRCFARLMNIKNEDQAAMEWVRLGLALEFSHKFNSNRKNV